ncbi:hypothetical protein Hdeb2414_s0071g00774021 [Helianthus debilis subsp. tardiflorus]
MAKSLNIYEKNPKPKHLLKTHAYLWPCGPVTLCLWSIDQKAEAAQQVNNIDQQSTTINNSTTILTSSAPTQLGSVAQVFS